MSEAMELSAILRQGSVADIKEMIPAVIYGSGIETFSLAVKRPEFEKVYSKSGESGLVSLKLEDGREMPVIIKDIQFDALKHRAIHVDFYKVNMSEKVTADTTLNFIGESPAVKSQGGIVVEHLDQLEVECLPADLVQKIDIDVSVLVNIGDSIYVKDIVMPKGVTVKNDPEEIVVHVIEPNKVVEEVPVVAEVAPVEGAAVTDVKAEEGKEGEATDKKTEIKKEAKK